MPIPVRRTLKLGGLAALVAAGAATAQQPPGTTGYKLRNATADTLTIAAQSVCGSASQPLFNGAGLRLGPAEVQDILVQRPGCQARLQIWAGEAFKGAVVLEKPGSFQVVKGSTPGAIRVERAF